MGLVLDGVLEVEGDDGWFVSGPTAASCVFKSLLLPDAPDDDQIAIHSRRAVDHAAALGLADPRELALRLYFFNRLPLTHRIASRWRTDPDVRSAFESAVREGSGSFRVVKNDELGPWLPLAARAETEARHKLYVSPRPEHLVDVFVHVLRVLEGHDCAHLKVGATHAGVLRPDKLVCYFSDLATLQGAAADLSGALSGVSAQGAPFTAAISSDGLLSRGLDPGRATTVVHPWFNGESWRLSVCIALASALSVAAAHRDEIDPLTFALLRVGLEDVNTFTWEPVE